MRTPDHETLPGESLEGVPAGCGYVLVLFVISLVVPFVVGFSLIMSAPESPTPWEYYSVWALFTLGAVALLFRGSARRWARNGVPRPYARAVLLTAVVAVSYVQSVVTWSFNNDFPLGVFWPAGSTVAAGTVLVMVALARGGRSATRVYTSSSEDSAGSRVSVGYTGIGPERVEVDTRIDHPARFDGVPRDPFYDGCRFFAVQCVESEVDGRRVLLVRDQERNQGHGPREFVRVRWNSFTFVDIEPEPVLWFRTTDREFFELARELHVADEDDFVALAEEVTGGPRP